MLFSYRSPRCMELNMCAGTIKGNISNDAYMSNYDALAAASIISATYTHKTDAQVFLHAADAQFIVEYFAPHPDQYN